MKNDELAERAETLRKIAEAAHAKHPQYANHWDGWILVRLKKTIRTKMGVAFVKGEYAIARPLDETRPDRNNVPRTFRTLYSVSNECDTSVEASAFDTVRSSVR